MSEKPKFKGCGAPSSHVIYRGHTRRLFSCANCLDGYEGNGRKHPYETDVAGQTKKDGVHYGPARACGFAVE